MELAEYADLMYTMSVHRIKVRYKQSLLGLSWSVLQPLSLMAIYTVIFSFIMKVPSESVPYVIFSFGGILPWLCFQTSLVTGTTSLVSNTELIDKVYFPREILPLSCMFASIFDFLVASSILGGMMVYYGVSITINIVYVIPIIVILVVFVSALSLVFSVIQIRFRDVGVALPLLLQLWMFATPVVYPLRSVQALPHFWQTLYVLNPMVGLIENFRRVVVLGHAPHMTSLLVSFLISFSLLPLAYAYFKRTDAIAADII